MCSCHGAKPCLSALPILGIVDQRAQEVLLLRLTIDHLYAHGEWPELRDVHRRIYREFGQDFDVGVVARRLVWSSYVMFTDLGERFIPPFSRLRGIDEAQPLLETLVAVVRVAASNYLTADNDAKVDSSEINEGSLDSRWVELVPTLERGVPHLHRGYTPRDGSWTIEVSDHVVRMREIETTDDLMDYLDAVEAENRRKAAEMASAHANLVAVSRKATPPPVVVHDGGSPDRVRWLESHPVVRSLLLAGAVATAIGAIVGLLAKVF